MMFGEKILPPQLKTSERDDHVKVRGCPVVSEVDVNEYRVEDSNCDRLSPPR